MGDSTFPQPRLLIIDDEPDLLELLTVWFQNFPYDFAVAADGYEALALERLKPFDVIITDLELPGPSGLQLLALLKAIDPTVEVIILTGQGTMEDAIEALREGRAFDFILKPVKNLRSLNEVIDRAIAKRRFAREVVIPPARPGSGKLLPVHIEALSAREREILAGLRSGLDNRLIADRLGVSEKTVKNSLTKVYEKLKVSNRTQAVLLAHQYDLI